MHQVILITVALLLTTFNLVMGKVLILNFKKRDDVLKLNLDETHEFETVRQLSEYLHLFRKLHDLRTDNFAIELIDSTGKFTTFEDSAAIQWSSNFLRVLIVDFNDQSNSGPLLSIGGRAFDSSSGLSIRSDDGRVSVIHIQVLVALY
jgi:hypothetical protein